ncbi:MAG TPA: hypothetical protein VKR99_00620 [Candidatus Eremiobacteraceae bacterium]|nr:hypothetical protein [Candidatus Eremiobacteraceae bacterium]
MKTPAQRSRNPLSDWYSPYFGPTTLLLAAAVLILSVQVGRYVGRQALHDVSDVPTPAAIHVSKLRPATKPVPRRLNTHTLHSKAHP